MYDCITHIFSNQFIINIYIDYKTLPKNVFKSNIIRNNCKQENIRQILNIKSRFLT